MAIDNTRLDCARCLGGGELEVCPRCKSNDVENTGPDGCEHDLLDGQTYDTVDCPDCDRTGDREDEDEDED